ncbi:MAG: homocysteine S-methyltransferase family protein [Phycisphaerales bacterium]|nr:homocysteine S-methyltransferase family protein [Phycisphaerales bacterium]
MPLTIDWLRSAVRVADGAWSTQLHARGFPSRTAAELACLEAPGLVAQLASDYLAAGAQVLCTNSFSANRLMLARRRIEADPVELCRAAAKIAMAARDAYRTAAPEPAAARTSAARTATSESRRRSAPRSGASVTAVGGEAHVAGVIGPCGSILAVGETPEAQIEACFAEAAGTLADAGVDALLFETFSEVEELLLALRAARGVTRLPLIACMSFDSGPQRTRTMTGQEAAACARALDEAEADVIGSNCGAGASEALPALFAVRSATERPVWVKPNVGPPELEGGVPVHRVSPEEFVEPFATLIEAGANVVGGCCGASPEHIRRLAASLRPKRSR